MKRNGSEKLVRYSAQCAKNQEITTHPGRGAAASGVGRGQNQTSSFVQAAFALDEATTASMKAMPRMPSSIFG